MFIIPAGKQGYAGVPAGTHMKITSTPNGPNRVDPGEPVSLSAGDTEKTLATPFYLCRCGLSKNKPLCDGSHLAGTFEAPPSEIRPVKKQA
jgi:CDGSH-type Zn-finger protein